MQPFGHSIPGEPLILIDGYRDIVRTEAAAMGIPLRDPGLPRNSEAFPERLRRFMNKSGVYVIRERDGDLVIVDVGQLRAGRASF